MTFLANSCFIPYTEKDEQDLAFIGSSFYPHRRVKLWYEKILSCLSTNVIEIGDLKQRIDSKNAIIYKSKFSVRSLSFVKLYSIGDGHLYNESMICYF